RLTACQLKSVPRGTFDN
uniref:Uncharacterized protein n=1 Tax=Petromyzon marinus TaxID=7757 RepID=S4RK34_PETMA